MKSIFHLAYVSSAVKLFSKHELAELLFQAREKNRKLGITGMLLYKGGKFMQVLEGEESIVRQLCESIRRDPRHHEMTVLLEENIPVRQFSDWSMGFRSFTDKDVMAMPGFTQYMNRSLDADNFKHDPSGCLKMLNLFRVAT